MNIYAGAVLFAAGIFMLCKSIIDIWRAQRSTRWPHAKAVIVSSTTDEDPSELGVVYFLRIKYEYVVHDIKYQSRDTRSWESWKKKDREAWNREVNVNQEGGEISVLYDPANPKVSVLKRGVKLEHVGSILFGLAIALLGAIVALGWLK
jgi:hypothetical protein